MRRSVRNGLAIAGMAGGMLFLGQAVASADEADQTAAATNTVTQEAASTDGGDLNVNANLSGAEATNVEGSPRSTTDVDGGDGGVNVAAVNTGVIDVGGPGGPPTASASAPGAAGIDRPDSAAADADDGRGHHG